MKIDKTDTRLLYELIDDSSQTDTKLGSKLSLSGVSIRNRINKLTENKVIEQFVPEYQAEPFGMDSMYLVASEKNSEELLKKIRIFGRPSFIMHCIGSTAILGIIVNENFEDKLDFARQLVNEGKVITVSPSKSPGFNKIITKTELKILQALIPNTQISNDTLASLTGFSKKTVSRTLQKLRKNDILHSTIIWNPKKIENLLTFYVGISIKNNAEETVENLTKRYSKFFLASPRIFDKEIVLTMYVHTIHEMDEIVEKIKSMKKINRADVYIPKKFELIYDWFNDFVKKTENGPLHLSLKSQG